MKKNSFKAPLQSQTNFLFVGSLQETKTSCCSPEQGGDEDECCPQPEDGTACCKC